LAERVLGKDEVTSSILVIGSILRSPLIETASFGWQAADSDADVSFGRQATEDIENRRTGQINART
jgi:hypothetical protein